MNSALLGRQTFVGHEWGAVLGSLRHWFAWLGRHMPCFCFGPVTGPIATVETFYGLRMGRTLQRRLFTFKRFWNATGLSMQQMYFNSKWTDSMQILILSKPVNKLDINQKCHIIMK